MRKNLAALLCLCQIISLVQPAVAALRTAEPQSSQAPRLPGIVATPEIPTLTPAAGLDPAAATEPAPAAVPAAAPADPVSPQTADATPVSASDKGVLARLAEAGRALLKSPSAAAATLDGAFDKKGQSPQTKAALAESLRESTQALFRLRRDVKQDAYETLIKNVGGQNGDRILYTDVRRVLDRLLAAQGRPPESAQIFIGNSFLPNAFTMLSDSERKYLAKNARLAKAFRVSNTFISMGLLRAVKNEQQLAFVLAHELSHNAKGHLKDFTGGASHMLLGHFHEFEADAEALKLVAAAGYDPRAGMDTLYALDDEMERLEKRYALVKRKQNDVAEAINRLRDVHPHSDLRRANMLDHLSEALELYKPAPVPENPVWMSRREVFVHQSRVDRFEARLMNAVRSEPDTRKALFILERLMQSERNLGFEQYAVIEEAYRELARRTRDDVDLGMLQVSTRRKAISAFPTRKLRAALTTRRLTLVFAALPEHPTLEQYFRASGSLSAQDRAAGALRVLGAMRDRAQLESAYQILSYGLESLGFDFSQRAKESAVIATSLWRAARSVLTRELGRPALPEEIIDELLAKLPASLLAKITGDMHVDIMDSAMGPEEYRSKRFRPSELVARLEGRKDFDADGFWTSRTAFKGRDKWRDRHYTAPQFKEEDGKVAVEYERYRLDGLSQPSQRDALDIVNWFTLQFYTPEPPRLTPPLLRLLRRDGGLPSFMTTFFTQRVDWLRQHIGGTSTPAERDELLDSFTSVVNSMLGSTLHEAKDLKSIRELVELAWQPVEDGLKTEELAGTYSDAKRSKLVDGFLQTASAALRRAVVSTDMAGRNPDRAEIVKMTALIQRMETVLRAHSAGALVRAHTANLAAQLDKGDAAYMRAYGRALDRVVTKPDHWIWGKISSYLNYQLTEKLKSRWQKLTAWLDGLFWGRKALPGISKDAERMLNEKDFTHFLAAVGDDSLSARQKLMYVALVDRLDANTDLGKDDFGRAIGLRGAAAVGRWLLQDLALQAKDAASLRALSDDILRLYDLQPALLQPDFNMLGTPKEAFRIGAQYVQRSENYLSLGRGEHPFRGVNTRWALELFRRLDAQNAWPESFERKLDLLDALNSTGEFSEPIDSRIVALATAEPEAFGRWIAHDKKRAERFYRIKTDPVTVKVPMGQSIPLPVTQPLRVVRNPNLRAKLFDTLPEAKLGENQPRRGLRETWKNFVALVKAYREARKFFSSQFLQSLRREESLENKFFEVLEEIDRIAAERTSDALERWNAGRFTDEEREWLGQQLDTKDPWPRWKAALPHDREQLVQEYKETIKQKAMNALLALYNAFTNTQDPVLALILHNYPEPTRSRDELLERLIKARKLRSGALTILESNKSYRMPNPVRVAEKQMLDQAAIQMRKFTAAERVDLLLHMAKVERLSPERLKEFDHRLLNNNRRKVMREMTGIRNIAQLEDYLSLMHRKDRALMVKSMFYGENALGADFEQSRRLFERLVIENRDLPVFMQKLLRAYFKILTPDERAQLISDIAAIEDVGSNLKGPEIMKVALKNGGVTGAKIAQVLATHKGVIPEKYAEYLADLEGFKEKAQEMNKMLAHDLIRDRIDKLVDHPEPASPYTMEELREIGFQALPAKSTEDSIGEKSVAREKLVKQVHFLLAEQKARVESIEAMGPELGAGSIKLVYKVKLDDGRLWASKIRAPGASYKSKREFQIIEDLIAELESTGDLDLPGIRQLVDEVRALVLAEMNFNDEAVKENGMRERIAARPWYARLIAPRPYVPRPHPVFVSEDLMIEEFVPTIRFSDLPRRSLIGPSQAKIAALAVKEGMFDLVFGEWLEPDPHTGNRHARAGWLYRFWTKLVVMDLGQGVPQPIGPLKPLMKAGVAVESGDAEAAASRLVDMVTVPPGETRESIVAAIAEGVRRKAEDGVVEALTEGLLEAEKKTAIVKPEYAALQKAFLIYAGYSPYLPKDFAFRSLQRAAVARVLRDRPWPLSRLVALGLRRLVLGPKAVRADMEALIDAL